MTDTELAAKLRAWDRLLFEMDEKKRLRELLREAAARLEEANRQ